MQIVSSAPADNTERASTKNTVSVVDAQLTVAASPDSEDLIAGKKYKATFPKQVDEVVSFKSGEHLFLEFKMKTQGSGKDIQPQQVFLRIGNDEHEMFFPARNTAKGYIAHIVADDLDDFYSESGVYSVELIVGDRLIQNPFSWNVAKVQITFSNTNVRRPENPFSIQPEIKHMFRVPEKRASPFLSFVFTIASLAPWVVLVIGVC